MPKAVEGSSANEGTIEDAVDDSNKTNGNLSLNNSHVTVLNESKVDYLGGESQITADGLIEKIVKCDHIFGTSESGAASQLHISECQQILNHSLAEHTKFEDAATSLSIGSGLHEDSKTLFALSSEQNRDNILLGVTGEFDFQGRTPPFDDMYLLYIDPQGNTQGPFQGADIISWFEQGYFGLELPVRLADAPEGTHFQSLGEVIPHLKLRGGSLSSELDQTSAAGRQMEPGLGVATIPDGTDLLKIDGHEFSHLNSYAVHHAESSTSKSEVPLELSHSEGQRFHDFIVQDEEVIFPGRLGAAGSSNTKASGNSQGQGPLSATSISNSLLSGDLREPSQSDSKLHPFGLLWSELQDSHARQAESSDGASSMGRAASFSGIIDPASVAEKWSDSYRQDTPSTHLFQDATVGRPMSHVEQEPNQFVLAEQLMLQQFQQQQLQQRNMMSSKAYLNESLIERMPNQLHQQLSNLPARDIEHLMAMQLQQQRQLQLHQQLQQQHQFHQLQQQQLLQEQQESQVRQMLLEQLLHGQISDPSLQQSHVEPIIANNALDKVLFEQKLLHEMQRTHHPGHFVPSVEDLNQAKFGQILHQDQQRDLLQLFTHSQHGQISSLEHQILQQEQLLARQSSLGLRQRTNMAEEERHMGLWPAKENDHPFRTNAANHRSHTSGINPLDFYQRQQRSSHEDQLIHLERNPSFQDQLFGLYDRASLPFERSSSLPASGMNMDMNAIAHAQALDMQDLATRIRSGDQVGAFSSGIQLQGHQHPVAPTQFHASQFDAGEGQWPDRIGHQTNDWMESQMQQLRINAERQNRESENKLHAKDLSVWMSDGLEEDKSRQLLMELLHQKQGQQHSDSGRTTDVVSFDQRALSARFSGASSSEPVFSDQGAVLSNSYLSNAFEPTEFHLGDEQVSNLEHKEKLPFRSDPGLGFDGNSFLSGSSGATPRATSELVVTCKSSANKEYQVMAKGSVPEVQVKAEQQKLAVTNYGEMPTNTHSRHSFIGVGDIYGEKIGHQSFFGEDPAVNKVPVSSSKGQNNSILLRRPPVPHAASSQEGLSEVIPNAVTRSKSSSNSADGGTFGNQTMGSMESGKRDVRFRRTASFGEAEISEPSFIDMLKSNAKKTTAAAEAHGNAGASESSDGTQGGRSGKKKGKKGKQIDPAFLGFKVTSNRIMMGEIQRVED